MFHATHTIRQTATALALAATIVAVVAPAALAGGNSQFGPPDGWYSYAVSITKQQHPALFDGRSPDTQDAAQTAQANLLTPVDGRSPDTVDAAVQAHSPVITVIQTPGFQWGDFGIGVAAALGLICLLAVSIRLLTAHKSRKQPGSVATA